MEIEKIKDAIRRHIIEHHGLDSSDPDFNDDVHLFEYGYIDSFGAVALIAFVEETCGIKISNEDLVVQSLNTVNEIAQFAQNKMKGNS